ncbi:alpha 1:2 mannosidase precursor-like protein [Leptotrombidium deliense]|uniref:alpha-1,2-Mannosidase n=1 Tax=Leptotrombidium deliense TaxID=299467 RepID=A0A443SD86_9ACAR|nr:alpha 1:2 mannosidase precursor-like protein [Leptotrombidium deliense]
MDKHSMNMEKSRTCLYGSILAAFAACILLVLSYSAFGIRMIPDVREISKNNKFYSYIRNENFMNTRNIPENECCVEKREVIREMMRHAWNGYVKHAWGHNELRPVSGSGHTAKIYGNTMLGATIVDAMDTLLIMNMSSEYEKGREWIANELNLENVNEYVSVFEMTIRFVGGLLSCFALTNDPMFLQKAKHITDKLLPAFGTQTGIPKPTLLLNSDKTDSFETNIAEAGSLHLEFVYLSYATNDTTYKSLVNKVRQEICGCKVKRAKSGLFPNSISFETGTFTTVATTLGAEGDSFYEYLLKAWIQSNGRDGRARELFQRAMTAVERRLVKKSDSGLYYLLEHRNGGEGMSHLACFSGGMFALAAETMFTGKRKERFKFLAVEITKTCRESYVRSETGVGPEIFLFNNDRQAKARYLTESFYILRPEVVESYFYLWRTTREQKYRDWAWDVVIALQKYCRAEYGFSGIRNVYDEKTEKDDVQQSFFLAETLKYLYLIFSDDLLPLDKWVYNTEGHPLPIKGRNTAYKLSRNS